MNEVPRKVTRAYWLWITEAVLLVVLAAVYLTFSTNRNSRVIGVCVVLVVVALAVALMARLVRDGDDRMRLTLVALSGSFTVLCVLAAAITEFKLVIFAAVFGIIASVMVSRGDVDEYFGAEPPATVKKK